MEYLKDITPFLFLIAVLIFSHYMVNKTKPMATRKPYKFRKIIRVLFEKNPEI